MPISIKNLQTVEWARNYLWDIKFPSYSGEFFPAVDVEEDILTINSRDFEFFMSTYSVPIGTSLHRIRVTFLSDQEFTPITWLEDWSKSILGKGKHVQTLEESVKRVHINKLKHDHSIAKESVYDIFPSGSLSYNGNSDSGTPMFTMEFIIAGKIDQSKGK